MFRRLCCVFTCVTLTAATMAWAEQPGGVDLLSGDELVLDGRGGGKQVEPGDLAKTLGTGDFTISMRVKAEDGDDVPGDLFSWRDMADRKSVLLSLKTSPGVTTSESNRRHLQFSLDDGRKVEWQDRGRPGGEATLLVFGMAVHQGHLYAGTCEPYGESRGHVYRYEAGEKGEGSNWISCGAPDASNTVMCLIVFEGELYAATGKYRVAGSSLPESDNEAPGGAVFRYRGGQEWELVGKLPEVEAIGGMGIYGGKLHATSFYRPAGFFRYEGGTEWTSLPVPTGPKRDGGEGEEPKRVQALATHDGALYASTYDGGRVYRWDGSAWTDLGQLGEDTQTYSFAVFEGRLAVGMWPSGRVYQLERDDSWTDLGRLGQETEVMGMAVHHGRFVGGTLPLAEIYEYRGGQDWERHTQLDKTPDVRYRRAWTMAEHDGGLFCSTLPSGHVHSWHPGAGIAWEHPFPEGWHHVAATRSGEKISLYVDGELVAEKALDPATPFDVSHAGEIQIGSGPNDTFYGSLKEVAVHDRALSPEEIQALARKP